MSDKARVNPINELDNRRAIAWRVFFEASGRLHGILEQRLKRREQITLADYHILLALWEAPMHSMRMGELANHVTHSPSRLTYLVTRLEGAGYVERMRAEGDGRGLDAHLTQDGIDKVLTATRLHQDTVREFVLDDLSEQDIDDIVRIFGGMDSRLKHLADGI